MSQTNKQTDSRSVSATYVDLNNFQELYRSMADWQRELVARKWLKENDFWWCKVQRLQDTYWHHLISLCRQPAGRADGSRGSQQCCFEMELWDERVEHMLNLRHTGFTSLPRKRYLVGFSGEVEWLDTRNIHTFYMDNREHIADYVRFREREVAVGMPAYAGSKAVVRRSGEGVREVCTLVPPLIIEICPRSLSLPPHFKYLPGECEAFKQLALEHLQGMCNAGHKMSKLMQKLLPPAYRDGELEGEEAECSDNCSQSASEHSEVWGGEEAV
eukprot:5262952-Pleurochrysis_carterae.AAC.2